MTYLARTLLLTLSLFAHIDDLDHACLEGHVRDSAGNPVVQALVIARNSNSGRERKASTDSNGHYRLDKMLPGDYVVSVEFPGFRSEYLPARWLRSGATMQNNFQLEPSPLSAEVTVAAGDTELRADRSRTVIGESLTRTDIDALPVESRNPYDLLFALSGTAPEALSVRSLAEDYAVSRFRVTPEEAGIASLNGGQPFSNNLTIEGLDNNDDRAARERFIPSAEATAELQVVTNQFSAEYGRASGGRINLHLKSGGSGFHGETRYVLSDGNLNANSFYRNADPARGFRLPFQDHDLSTALGGRLSGRASFFSAYEYDHTRDSAEISALVPVASNTRFPLPAPNGAVLGSTEVDRSGKVITVNGGAPVGLLDAHVSTPLEAHTLEAKLDVQINSNHQGWLLLLSGRQRDLRGFPGGKRTLDTIRERGRSSDALAFGDSLVLSTNVTAVNRFQFSRLSPIDAPAPGRPVVLISIDDPRDVPGNPNANLFSRTGNLLAGSSNSSATDRRESRAQAQSTINFSSGRHSLRFGADVQIIRSRYADLEDSTGTFTFDSPADFLANAPSRYRHRFNTDSELHNFYQGFFVQDDLRLTRSLLLAIGLRWDNETIIADRNNFGPRVALAWSPTGRTVFRAGYGIFYNRALLRTLDDFLLTSQTLLVDTNQPRATYLLSRLSFPVVLEKNDPQIAAAGVHETGFIRRLERSFRIPESYQAAAGVEREIGAHWRLELNYVFNRGLHLWRESNINAPSLPAGYQDFTSYLLSRDFDNAFDPLTGARPITSSGSADLVRFNLSQKSSEIIREGGKSIAVFGLNDQSTSNASAPLKAALATVRNLRPDPRLTQVEELEARGNSFYHGLTIALTGRLGRQGNVRASYTLSRMIDDGVVNTSSPLVPGDFARERALSLIDARHRLAASGVYQFPRMVGGLMLAGVFNLSSARPFNLGINGNDRNLDDVDNDRPEFNLNVPVLWRTPGSPPAAALLAGFSLPTIGTSGGMARNAGRGPRQSTLSLRISRRIQVGENLKLTPQVEAFNPLNATVFNFGAEFIDFVPSSLGNFLVPPRTVRPRSVRAGVKFEF